MTRKHIPKKIRKQVYEKYGGRCAYCGCELEYKDMQVDHVEPVYLGYGGDDIDNLMPACRMCNFYKSTFTLEKFRERLKTIPDRLERDFTYRMAKKYGIVEEHKEETVRFYFENIDCFLDALKDLGFK